MLTCSPSFLSYAFLNLLYFILFYFILFTFLLSSLPFSSPLSFSTILLLSSLLHHPPPLLSSPLFSTILRSLILSLLLSSPLSFALFSTILLLSSLFLSSPLYLPLIFYPVSSLLFTCSILPLITTLIFYFCPLRGRIPPGYRITRDLYLEATAFSTTGKWLNPSCYKCFNINVKMWTKIILAIGMYIRSRFSFLFWNLFLFLIFNF